MKDLLINVGETPHKGFLDSEAVIADIKKHLTPWCRLIEDITNYGTNLIPRCFTFSDKELKDAVVLAILLRQVVAMLDGVHILLSSGACQVAQLPSRALFEASVYIDWILLGDQEKKARYYYVHNLRRLRMWARRTQEGSTEATQFFAAVKKSGMKISDQVKASSKRQLQQIDKVLSQPALAEVCADFDNHRKRNKYDPAWYVPLGQRNLRTMAEAVDKLSQYTILYSSASEVMHASSFERHIALAKGEITFQPIRSVEGFETALRFSVGDALSTYRKILQEYRPSELEVFAKKYKENWQTHFMNFPDIKVEVNPIRI